MYLKFSYKNSQKISISKLIRVNAFIEGIKIFPTVNTVATKLSSYKTFILYISPNSMRLVL